MTSTTRQTPIETLCAALHAGGFTLAAESRSTLSLRPRAGVSKELADLITKYREKLLEFLADRGSFTPHPCAFCCGEFVHEATAKCPDCQRKSGRPLRFRPGSEEETDFLRALEARRKSTGETLPNCPNGQSRPGWDS